MTDPGLCAGCSHGREIRSDRGSVFWLCRRSATDPRFPRYPALPVRACAGFELVATGSDVVEGERPAADGQLPLDQA